VRSTLYATYGSYKVWQRPMNKGRGFRFEVRKGNSVIAHFGELHLATAHAKELTDSFWAEQARVYYELKAKGELE